MNKTLFITAITAIGVVAAACGTPKNNTIKLAYKDYDIGKTYVPDTGIQSLLLPYRDSVDKAMGKVIGTSAAPMKKKDPESELGNFMADAMRTMAAKKFATTVDVAVVNSGGIRSDLPQGPIALRNIYELMPFDNIIVLQQLKGSTLKTFFNHIASKGGWPLSGATMQIRDNKAINILVNGKPVDDNAVYTVANSDYVANGGDNCDMLRPLPQKNIGYLYRDALIQYVEELTAQHKPIHSAIENRVTNVK